MTYSDDEYEMLVEMERKDCVMAIASMFMFALLIIVGPQSVEYLVFITVIVFGVVTAYHWTDLKDEISSRFNR